MLEVKLSQKASKIKVVIAYAIAVIGLIATTSTLYLLAGIQERRISFCGKLWDQHPEIMQTRIDEIPISDFMTGVYVTLDVCRVWLQVLLLTIIFLIFFYFVLYLKAKRRKGQPHRKD